MSENPEFPYCGTSEDLRMVHDGGGYEKPEHICEACFEPRDDGPCFDDLALPLNTYSAAERPGIVWKFASWGTQPITEWRPDEPVTPAFPALSPWFPRPGEAVHVTSITVTYDAPVSAVTAPPTLATTERAILQHMDDPSKPAPEVPDGLLRSLLDRGLVERVKTHGHGERYAITEAGRQMVREET